MKILKCTRKLLSLVIVFVMILSLSTASFALDNSKETLYKQAKLVANSYMQNSGSCKDPIELYNLNEEVAALFFASGTSGYVIVKLNDFSVPEYSTESNNTFITDKNAKYYYNGPLVYLKQVNNQLLDLPGSKLLGTVQEVKNGMNRQAAANGMIIFGSDHKSSDKALRDARLSQVMSAKAVPLIVGYITGTVPNYSYNPNGICAATASAMYARYYDIYRDNNYVPVGLETAAGVLLTITLATYIPVNAIPFQVVNGLSSYLTSQGVSSGIYAETATSMNISACIANNEPFVMLINNHPTYGNHYVTGYGYSFNSSANYAIVNNGWGSTGVYINLNYANTIVHQ
jgi:hypothetical protein